MLVPLILYLNLENTLIPRTLFPQLLTDTEESYLGAIENMDKRVHLVAPAKDWVMLSIANPRLLNYIRESEIPIMPTTFSHMLPDLFPEAIETQFQLSKKILQKLFEKIIWHGIIPENTVSSLIVPSAVSLWDGVILSVGHNNLRGLNTGSYNLKGSGETIPLEVIGNSIARLDYMAMFREQNGSNAVFQEMEMDDHTKACLFDFERPWSNIVYYPHSGYSPSRIDIWNAFHNDLKTKDISPWYKSPTTYSKDLFLKKANLNMWVDERSQWLIDIQQEILQSQLGKGDYFELAALVATSCMPPRVLTRFMQDDSFPSKYGLREGTVNLVGDMSKVKELLFICKNIQQRQRVDYGAEFLSMGEQLYLKLLHQTLIWIEKYLS